MMADRRTSGFTLVEVLVATAIFVTVMSIVYSIFSSISGQIAKVEAEEERLKITAFLMRELSTTLASAFLYFDPANPMSGDPTFAFISEDREVDVIDADSLTFVSMAPPLGGAGVAGGLKVVTISMEVPPEEELERMELEGTVEPTYLNLREQQMLSIGVETYQDDTDTNTDDDQSLAMKELFEESPAGIQWTADEGMFSDSDSDEDINSMFDTEPVWSVEVASFNLQFYNGVDWVDTWNSVEAMGMLPWAVKVELDFPPDEDDEDYEQFFLAHDEDEEHDFVAVVTLPAGYGMMPEDFNYLARSAMPRTASGSERSGPAGPNPLGGTSRFSPGRMGVRR
jgi:prepilin-type N-terminal cleavage/methylation domain-containing protein